mmetsp:Transcript_3587/g.10518  ORF Transcript_3587/g.10518 Transcript_3587/m.10518 type:complete len:265 (+) Transcript_3587:743-1537(+)
MRSSPRPVPPRGSTSTLGPVSLRAPRLASSRLPPRAAAVRVLRVLRSSAVGGREEEAGALAQARLASPLGATACGASSPPRGSALRPWATLGTCGSSTLSGPSSPPSSPLGGSRRRRALQETLWRVEVARRVWTSCRWSSPPSSSSPWARRARPSRGWRAWPWAPTPSRGAPWPRRCRSPSPWPAACLRPPRPLWHLPPSCSFSASGAPPWWPTRASSPPSAPSTPPPTSWAPPSPSPHALASPSPLSPSSSSASCSGQESRLT